MIKVGIIGGTGYTAGELIRILLIHPKIIIKSVLSNSCYGNYIHHTHRDILGDSCLKFTNKLDDSVDIVFLCVGHGLSKKIIDNLNIKIKIIDLSQDFRLKNNSHYNNRLFIYGLPEQQRELIKNSRFISNPGCFATAIQLALLPIANINYLKNDIHISAITGSTGAGKNLTQTNNFSWRTNNISNYKVFQHQHLFEIKEGIIRVQNNFNKKIYFVPYRGNFSRGIITTLYTDRYDSLNFYKKLYYEYYKTHPFVKISDYDIDIKQVIGSNKCILHLNEQKDKIIITSVIDNLIKGASGQAVQNFNIMYNIEEQCGLRLKSIGI